MVHMSGVNGSSAILFSGKGEFQNKSASPAWLKQATFESRISISVVKNPTELILQSAMEKINEMFAPHLGEGVLEKAVNSGLDISPEATAERILSFATQLIGRAESEQIDLSIDERRSRAQLFENIQIGIERGFEQARGILEGLSVLNEDVKETVDSTYDAVQKGLQNLSTLLGLLPSA